MCCGEVKTFLKTANTDGNALEEVMKMGLYYYYYLLYFFFFAKSKLLLGDSN